MKSNITSAIILAAGKSERMNFPKSLLKFAENQTFIEKIVREFYNFGCEKIFIVTNERDFHDLKKINLINSTLIINNRLDLGRFFSVKLGLLEALSTKSEYFFFHNTDNPFLNQNILNLLFDAKSENSYITPFYNDKGGHPVLISRKIAEYLKKESSIDSNLKEELAKFARINIEIDDEKILANINNKEIYDKYFETVFH